MRQFVNLAGGGWGQAAADEDAGRLQLLQSLRQHVGADSGQAGAQIGEALWPQHQFPHDGHGPAVPDKVQRMGDCTAILIGALFQLRVLSYFL